MIITYDHHTRKTWQNPLPAHSWTHVWTPNSLLYGVSSTNASRLQLVQNTLARVVTGSGRREHITPTLNRLHWLPVKHRIDYKIAAMTFKARQTGEPAYLNALITAYTPARSLRSAAFNRLATPSVTSRPTVALIPRMKRKSSRRWANWRVGRPPERATSPRRL